MRSAPRPLPSSRGSTTLRASASRLRADESERRHLLELAAAELGADRRAAAERLATAVNTGELEPLGLPAGSFGVALEPVEMAA